MLKDILGNELQVGDYVCYSRKQSYGAGSELIKLQITKIKKNSVRMGKYEAYKPHKQLKKISESQFNIRNIDNKSASDINNHNLKIGDTVFYAKKSSYSADATLIKCIVQAINEEKNIIHLRDIITKSVYYSKRCNSQIIIEDIGLIIQNI